MRTFLDVMKRVEPIAKAEERSEIEVLDRAITAYERWLSFGTPAEREYLAGLLCALAEDGETIFDYLDRKQRTKTTAVNEIVEYLKERATLVMALEGEKVGDTVVRTNAGKQLEHEAGVILERWGAK